MKKILSSFLCLLIISKIQSQCAGAGTINYQRWDNITGTTVASLTSNVNYPNNPTSTGTRTLFEMPVNIGSNFGLRMNGFICPPTTGSYRFWIASDAAGELWLSTTSSPANKVRRAYHTGTTTSRQWNKYSTQKSVAISLVANQVYYIEALMKESTGNDNLAVGWSKPGQSTSAPSEVIPGTYLLPDAQAPTPPANLSSSVITETTFTLSWTSSSDNIGVAGYDVYQNGVKINAATITTTSYNVTGLLPATTYSYYVIAKDAAGNQSVASSGLNVTTAAPDTEPPTIPTNLSSAVITQTSFTLRWNASTDNVGVAGYDVYKDGVKINVANITTTSYNITGLTPATSYAFSVIAKDAAGNQSAAVGASLNVTTLTGGTASESFTMRTVIANQRMPHDLVYGPDGNLWFTERFSGKVSFVNPSTGLKTTVLTLGAAMVRVSGQDGLLGLALHPEFITGKPYIYISYTYNSTSATVRKIRIERYTYNSGTQLLESPAIILQDIPGSNDHNSARIAIGPDLKLYYSAGDMGAGQFDNLNRINNAQNLNIYEGKILRLNTELINASWIPADNPYTNGGLPTAVYTYGHRNPQGLVWGNVIGNILYSSEHGPFSDDELNTIEVGRNYGWPNVIGWCDGNYNGRTTGGFAMVNEQNNCVTLNAKEPVRSLFPSANPPSGGDNSTWPSVGHSGMDFYGSNAIPGWQNSLLVAQLKKGAVARYKLSNDGLNIISDTIHYFKGLGRFRDVVVSPDGLKIYVACDSSGQTSGPTGGTTTTPANPGSILEFTFQPPAGMRSSNQLLTNNKITEDVKNITIDVYPNPSSTFFIVYNYKEAGGRTIALMDMNGRMVKRQLVNSMATRIETTGLSNGLYILRVTASNGKVLRTQKIIVQK